MANGCEGMVQFGHICRKIEGEMKMEIRIKVWLSKALHAKQRSLVAMTLYTPSSSLCTHIMIAFESELCS